MRPPELNVLFSINELDCRAPEDSGGDEPYMWILGFKVDADTITPRQGSLLPHMGVQIFDGAQQARQLLAEDLKEGNGPIAIPSHIGARSFRLRPAFLDMGGWFAGLTGLICILWDEDEFSAETVQKAHNKFKEIFGPTLANELDKLIDGGYDDQLSRNANGVVVSPPSSNALEWRLTRLGDSGARSNATSSITTVLKDEITAELKTVFLQSDPVTTIVDRDDSLGAEVQAHLGTDLRAPQAFSMRFTEDEADYTAHGHVSGTRVYHSLIDSQVFHAVRHFEYVSDVVAEVCWLPERVYFAYAYRLEQTIRLQLRPIISGAPTTIKWCLNDVILEDGAGQISVIFEPLDRYVGSPQDVLAYRYPGGSGTISYRNSGPVLDLTHTGGIGAFFGTVTAVYAYENDPPLTASGVNTRAELARRGYEDVVEIGFMGAEFEMDEQYRQDVKTCKRVVAEIDRKRISVNWGKAIIDPGDPPPTREQILEKADLETRIVSIASVRLLPHSTATARRVLKPKIAGKG
ncbi:MAG: hypothetical protein LZF86_100282 [Nitrospira sp.]|nr:MAG: hypothetical protein LZF86_100282 [Nitrospira sp.]